jgi:hypothetical protein
MFLHRLRRAALHLPLQRQERGLLYFHHGLLGILNGIVMTIAHTETDEVIRIISARKATRYEEESYFIKIRK